MRAPVELPIALNGFPPESADACRDELGYIEQTSKFAQTWSVDHLEHVIFHKPDAVGQSCFSKGRQMPSGCKQFKRL
jgi:hypothetical protein